VDLFDNNKFKTIRDQQNEMYCFDVLAMFSFLLTGSYYVDLFGYKQFKTTRQDHKNEIYCGVAQLAQYISQILLKYYIPTIEMLVK
jgi:hypothetical protein